MDNLYFTCSNYLFIHYLYTIGFNEKNFDFLAD